MNYSTGLIVINALNISNLADSDFRLKIVPSSNDIVSVRNNLISIRPELVNVTVIADNLASGNSAGSNYIFTPSR